MTKISRTASIVALAVAITAIVTVLATRPAAAQTGAWTVTCTDLPTVDATVARNWMQQQLESGRTRFVTIRSGLCAY